jgi:dTDP-4-amino-4,6-dideoxygalactose transaminase
MKVPFFRPSIGEAEIAEVVRCLQSGWITTGAVTSRFQEEFAAAVGARHALALNSCTAALHLAVEALGLQAGQAVLVPAMTFAATAEVVLYQRAVPVLVDCAADTLNMDLDDAERKLAAIRRGQALPGLAAGAAAVGVMPVHVGGHMLDMDRVRGFAARHGLWVVEDAAHAFPAAWRPGAGADWQRCGEDTAAVTCFSFYANKTITTGEGGMAVTADAGLAARMQMMALHGLSRGAWQRYRQNGSWDYQILEAGFKYNMTDVAAALGVHQLRRAEAMRQARERLARRYLELLAHLDEVELPPDPPERVHSWHLLPLRLRLDRLDIDRDAFGRALQERGVGVSVHWRPLHLHEYYRRCGWSPEDCPTASAEWERRLSLPLFPDMTEAEQDFVIEQVAELCRTHRSASPRAEPALASKSDGDPAVRCPQPWA